MSQGLETPNLLNNSHSWLPKTENNNGYRERDQGIQLPTSPMPKKGLNRSASYGQACLSCFKAKTRCIPRADSNECERSVALYYLVLVPEIELMFPS